MTTVTVEFWQRQRVLLTGHTGFKGAWLTLWLESLGAKVFGVALPPDTQPNLFELLWSGPRSALLDIRDRERLCIAVDHADPTVVIHMAAQSLVRRGYRTPIETFATNVMGTANLLECLRRRMSLSAVVVVTTDKVYRNLEDGRPFREDDALGAHDPYSASKAAAEITTRCWSQSFTDLYAPVVTARAGNVIGGGDWAEDRLVPDFWRAIHGGKTLRLRNPDATRPWQHVLEPLGGYLLFAEKVATEGQAIVPALNFGPRVDDVLTVAEVAETLLAANAKGQRWETDDGPQPPEMQTLALDSSLAVNAIGWKPRLTSRQAIDWTAEWYRRFEAGEEPRALCLEQISRYEAMP